MHIAVHDSLRGDAILGEDAQQRFLATRFNNAGQAIDAMGLPCSDIACPHCRRKLPPGFLETQHHIISIVGDQSAGKSYYLGVLTKMLPGTLYRDFQLVFQDSDPTGNAPVNEMRKTLFAAQTPAQAKLAKTQMTGGMYESLPRQGRTVLLPRPFVYSIASADNRGERCALIFYDNAGEHFQPGVNMVEQPGAQHVASAAGILFLFDPFNSPEFRCRLIESNDPQMEKTVIDQHSQHPEPLPGGANPHTRGIRHRQVRRLGSFAERLAAGKPIEREQAAAASHGEQFGKAARSAP